MSFDLNWIGKVWEVPRIETNSKYAEKYVFQFYSHLRVGTECGIMLAALHLCNKVTFRSSRLGVNSGLTNLWTFYFPARTYGLQKLGQKKYSLIFFYTALLRYNSPNIQFTDLMEIQPHCNKAAKKINSKHTADPRHMLGLHPWLVPAAVPVPARTKGAPCRGLTKLGEFASQKMLVS